jgi:hypothetical protein
MSRRAIVEWPLWVTLVASGAILAARTLFGPLDALVQIHSPLNAEGCFALAILLLILLRSDGAIQDNAAGQIHGRSTLDVAAIASLVLLIALVFAGNLHDYFLSDDFLIVHYANDYHFGFRQAFATGGGDGFFRPIANISLALTAPWTGFNPLRWHAMELALHAMNAALTFCLARFLRLDSLTAWLAAALFAVHGSRPEAAVWISGRFDLQATFFVLLALVLYLRSQTVLALVAMTLGILSKESAYITPMLIALLPSARGDFRWKNRIFHSAPFFLVAASLFAYRWVLFGSVGGYVTQSGQPQLFSFNILSALKGLCFRLPAILLFPINWSWQPGYGLGAAMAAYLAAVAWLASRRVEFSRLILPLGFIVISALPPLQQLLIGTDLQKARYLYLPSVGLCLLLAILSADASRGTRALVWSALLAFHVTALWHNLGPWHYAASKTRTACVAAAAAVKEKGPHVTVNGLPGSLNGVYFFSNGFPECVAAELGGIPAEIELRPAGDGASLLVWDAQSAELKAQQANIIGR